MTPVKAFAWTLAYVFAGSSIFWKWVSRFVAAGYRYWFVDVFFLGILGPLSWYVYRSYRNGSMHCSFANLPKSEQRVMAIVGPVFFVCAAAVQTIDAWLTFPDHRLWRFAPVSVWLVLGAENWRHYLELKGPEISSSQ
jgi:hypothetical protein